MIDTFGSHSHSITAPPNRAIPITPSDTDDLDYVTRALYVGGSGHVRVLTQGGDDVTYRNLVGTKILRVIKVFATGTTASDIVAEW